MAKLFEVHFEDRLGLDGLIKDFPVATRRALTRTANSCRTEASRVIRQTWNIKKADIDPAIAVEVKTDILRAIVRATGRRFPLTYFITGIFKKGGFSFQIKKGSPKTIIRDAFLVKGRYGFRIMTRTGKMRLPIEEKYSISIAEMFGSKIVEAAIIKKAEETFPKELDHQIDAITKGYAPTTKGEGGGTVGG